MGRFTERYLTIKLLLYAVSFILIAFALAVPLLGIEGTDDFFLNRWFGIRRSEVLLVGLTMFFLPLCLYWNNKGRYIIPILFIIVFLRVPLSFRATVIVVCGASLYIIPFLTKLFNAKNKEYWIRVTLVCVSSIFVLVLVEGYLQVKHRMSYTVFPYGMRGGNFKETFYIGFTPNFVGVSKRSNTEYRTNRLGFRDDPVIPSSDHLIFLGDSTSFGLDIRHEDTYSEQVEQRLNNLGYTIQSVNTASPGQGTVGQLRVLDALWKKSFINPRAVILGFFTNDFSDNMRDVTNRDYLEERNKSASITQEEEHEMQPIVEQKIRFHFRTWLYLETSMELLSGKYKPPYREGQLSSQEARKAVNQYGEYRHHPGREVEWDWLSREQMVKNRSYQMTIKALREIIQLCHNRGLTLIFLRLPPEGEILSEKNPLYRVMLEEELRHIEDVVYIDVRNVHRNYLNKQGLTSLPSGFYSRPGDASHPGPLACTLISEALEPVIIQAIQKQNGFVDISKTQ